MRSKITDKNPPLIDDFIALYQSLNKDNLDNLAKIYAPEIVFVDPAHQLKGLENVRRYFTQLYENTQSVSFDIESVDSGENYAWLRWTMTFTHPQLNKNNPVYVKGCTYVKYDRFITFHQDYFDLGAMLYENIPVLGRVIRWFKHRLSKPDNTRNAQ